MGSLPPRKRHKEKAGRIDRRVSLRSVHAHESVLAEQTVMLDRSSNIRLCIGFKIMFFSGFLRNSSSVSHLVRPSYLRESAFYRKDIFRSYRRQSAAFLRITWFCPSAAIFLLFLICVTLLLLKKLHFLLLSSSKTGRNSSGTTLERIKNLQKQRIATPAGRQSSSVAAKKGKKIGRPPVFK